MEADPTLNARRPGNKAGVAPLITPPNTRDMWRTLRRRKDPGQTDSRKGGRREGTQTLGRSVPSGHTEGRPPYTQHVWRGSIQRVSQSCMGSASKPREWSSTGKPDAHLPRMLAMTDDEVMVRAAKNLVHGLESSGATSHEEYHVQIWKGGTSDLTGRPAPCEETRTEDDGGGGGMKIETSSYGDRTGDKRRHRYM